MTIATITKFVVRYTACSYFLLAMPGCASSPPTVSEKLDELTGVTITYISTPLMFYRDNLSLAAYARNFVNTGPMQINRSGSYQYFLWVSSWSTIQLADPAAVRDSLESIVVFADGEPLPLELSGWTPDAIGISEPVYLKPTASATDAYYQVTVDQIRLIAEATDIRLRTAGPLPREYELWDDQKPAKARLAEFVRLTQW